MNTCPICKKRREPLKFAPIAYTPDEKLAFVERVCGLLIQSRYGMDRVYEELPPPRIHVDYENDQDVFFADATSFIPPRGIGILKRWIEKVRNTASLFTNLLKNPGTQTRSPSTLGRGSPMFRVVEEI